MVCRHLVQLDAITRHSLLVLNSLTSPSSQRTYDHAIAGHSVWSTANIYAFILSTGVGVLCGIAPALIGRRGSYRKRDFAGPSALPPHSVDSQSVHASTFAGSL